MKKIIYISLFTLITTVAYGQEKVVGINTIDPKATLDVEGTMRIDDLGTPSPNSVPLVWNEDNQKISIGSDGDNTPMRYLTYEIKMEGTSLNAYTADLKIDSNKYLALLTQAYLVRDNVNYNDISKSNAYINLIAKKVNDDDSVVPVKIESSQYGTWAHKDGSDFIKNNRTENNKFILGISQQETGLKINEKGHYCFFGNYYKSESLDDQGPYTWVVDVLVIKKNLVKETGF